MIPRILATLVLDGARRYAPALVEIPPEALLPRLAETPAAGHGELASRLRKPTGSEGEPDAGARLSRLSDASHRITRVLYLDTVLQEVVDDARSLTGAPSTPFDERLNTHQWRYLSGVPSAKAVVLCADGVPCRGWSLLTMRRLQVHRPRVPELLASIVYCEFLCVRSLYRQH